MDVCKGTMLLCRTCGSPNQGMTPITSSHRWENVQEIICDVIMKCASVQIQEGDGLPEHVCQKCIEDMSRAFLFKKLCEETDLKLRTELGQSSDLNQPCQIKVENLTIQQEFEDILSEVELKQEPEDTFLNNYGSRSINDVEDVPEFVNVQEMQVEMNEDSAYNSIELQTKDSDHRKNNQNVAVKGRVKKPRTRQNSKKRIHTCSICAKTFNTKSHLDAHESTHSDKRPHKCEICAKTFVLDKYLKQHMLIHTAKKPHQCTLCNSSFNHKQNLASHMHTHTGERPYKCDICSLSFTQKYALGRHVQIHTYDKPYKCGVCKSSFSRSRILKQHVKVHGDKKGN